jgi:flavin-dependent dehydrogenase
MQRDVIIVGGGLAGIMAAFSAQAEGAEVLLIDRDPLESEPIRSWPEEFLLLPPPSMAPTRILKIRCRSAK